MKISSIQALLVGAFLFFAGAVFAADAFMLQNIRTSESYGPFQLRKGEIVKIGNIRYQLGIAEKNRVSFKSVSDGLVYGPLQAVEGRLGVIGNATYCFHMAQQGATGKASGASGNSRAAADAGRLNPYIPTLPPMPERIAVPEEKPISSVPPKDLPALPDQSEAFRFSAWLALVDNTPVDWKLGSASSGDGAIERFSVGGDVIWHSWSAALMLSPSMKADDIVSHGAGITGASLDDGSGYALEIGYHRPFIVEGGWVASAGLRGQLRNDEGTLTTVSLVSSGIADTNSEGNVKSEYIHRSASVTIRELSLWLDVELAYNMDDWWGVYTDFSIQPISEYSISGSIPYGSGKLSLDAERSIPVAVTFGGWYVYERWRLFADFTVGADRQFRLGGGCDF